METLHSKKSATSSFAGIGPAILFIALILAAGWLLKCLGGEHDLLTPWGTFLTGGGTVGFGVATLYAAFVGIREFRRNLLADEEKMVFEKAKWLSQLFEEFYKKDIYKDIRRRIDFGEVGALLALIRKDSAPNATFSPDEQLLFDSFTDYLNLFEFVAYLKELKQLDNEDIKALFAYYLKRLVEIDVTREILPYIEANGYGNLHRMLKGYSG